MAQQTTADETWTEAQNANDLAAGDDVRLRNTANGSVELEGTVRSSLGDVGTVQVRVGGVRTSEVYAEGDGEWAKRGTCWTYTLEVRREVATDGGQAQQQADDEQEAEQVAVAYTTARRGDLKVETGRVLEDSPYQHRTPQDDETYVAVERDGSTVYLRVPDQGGNVYALHHATKRHDTRQGSLVDCVAVDEVEHSICLPCGEWLDHTVPVNTGHATTGDSGCPHCHEAEGVRSVCHEVGQERTVLGGYVGAQSRDHGSSVTLEAARAITQD